MFQLPCRRTDSLITITSGASGSGSGTVNYSVAANTLSISRSSSLTIAGLTHNVSQVGTGGGCTNTIVNPGFESGTTPWTFSGQVTRSTGSFPHSGTAYALQFWLNITTNEAAGASVFDRLFIEGASRTFEGKATPDCIYDSPRRSYYSSHLSLVSSKPYRYRKRELSVILSVVHAWTKL